MADTPSPPPGWPTGPPAPGAYPPPAPTPAPPNTYEPLPPRPPNTYEPAPPSSYPPPPPTPPPPSSYPPPAPPIAYPPPPPGWVPPPPGKKSYRNIWITVAVIIGALALGIGSCTVWFIGTVKAPVDQANRFLAAIDAGDYDAAVALTDPGCNLGMTAADLDDLFAGADITYDLKSSSIVNREATVSGSFSAADRSFTRIELSLRNQDGWSVCGFRVT